MRKGVVVAVRAEDRERLAAIIGNRNSPQKHVWRARILLLTADALGTVAIMRQSKSVVWRWQERFMQEGVDGLLRHKTRPSRKPPLDQAVLARVVEPTAGEPPGEATHWTAAANGQGYRDQRLLGSADLARPRSCAAPAAPVQALQRPEVCREAEGRGRPRSLSSGRP